MWCIERLDGNYNHVALWFMGILVDVCDISAFGMEYYKRFIISTSIL
jgi:hypothetical protein